MPDPTPHLEPRLERLLAQLGDARIRAGGWLAETASPARLATGLDDVDHLLGGGFPRGRLSEITGSLSSGRTSLALALVAAATRAGEVVAWVDAADALDPASLEATGADPERLLWVRAPGPREALRCVERLTAARGFALVVLDLHSHASRRSDLRSTSDWMRLAHTASASGTALVVLGGVRHAARSAGLASLLGSFAALVVDLRATRLHFASSPAWLEGLETRVALARHRLGAHHEGFVPVCWKVTPLASEVPARVDRSRSGASAA